MCRVIDNTPMGILKEVFKWGGIMVIALALLLFGLYMGAISGARQGYDLGYADGQKHLTKKRDFMRCPLNYEKVKCNECGREYDRLSNGNN